MERSWIARRLGELSLLYGQLKSPEELLLLSELWAQALAGEDRGDVERALVLHVRESRRFPVPADILSLVPRCRHADRSVDAYPALPEESCAPARQVQERAAAISQAVRRGGSAGERMADLLGRTCDRLEVPEVRQ